MKVNGEIKTELGTKVKPTDTVEVEGIKLEQEDKLYILSINLHKLSLAFLMTKVERSLLIISNKLRQEYTL